MKTFFTWWLGQNSSRIHLRRWNEEFSKRVDDGDYVLDAGSGEAPYRDLFASANYETADFEKLEKQYEPSTYVCDLQNIPVEDARFHYVIFNQVLEHLPEPIAVLKELNRVMKPQGQIICTCPLFYEEHEQPYDFFRYTQFAHRHMFDKANFEIEQLEWMEGYFGTIGYQMECIFKYLPVNPANFPSVRFKWVAVPVMVAVKYSAFLLAGLFYRMDTQCRFTARGMPKNYLIIAKKRGSRDLPASEASDQSLSLN